MKVPRKLRLVLFVVLCLFILWIIYYASISVIYGAKLRKLEEQVKAEGGSLTMAEVVRQWQAKQLPASENAAFLYGAAGDIMEMRSGPGVPDADAYHDFYVARMGDRARVVSEKRAALEAWLRDSALPLEVLHEAAGYERAHFDLEFSEDGELRVGHLAQLNRAAHLLMLEAWLAAEAGDSRKALQATWAMLRIRRAAQDVPIGFAQLMGVFADELAAGTLQRIMPLIQPKREDLLPILRELQTRTPNGALVTAEGMRRSSFALAESARKNGLSFALREEPARLRPWVPLAAVVRILNGSLPDEVSSLVFMNHFVKAASQADSMTVAELWRCEGNPSNEFNAMRRTFLFHYITLTRVPVFIEAVRPYKEDIARCEVATCGIAAELYRLDHADYPTSLDALSPGYLAAVPNDTFTGNPVHFKRLANGVLIYSVGLNGRDDSGAYDQSWDKPRIFGPADDIAWRVERPAAQ